MNRGYVSELWPVGMNRLGEVRVFVCGRTTDEPAPAGAAVLLEDEVSKEVFETSEHCRVFSVYQGLTFDNGMKIRMKRVEGYQGILSRPQLRFDPNGENKDEIVTIAAQYVKTDGQKPITPVSQALTMGMQAKLTATATLITAEERARMREA